MGSTGQATTNDFSIIDLFAGPGGLDVGARWLGLSSVGIEIDADACATRASAGLKTEPGDVRSYGPSDFPEANVLAGGPPCQTYTLAGNGSGRRALDKVLALADQMATQPDAAHSLNVFDDERTGLVLEPLRWALTAIKAENPYKVIVLEQVPSVLPIWKAVSRVLKNHGYGVDLDVLRTEQYGVPQTRRRAILIARWNDDVSLPPATNTIFRKGADPIGETGLLPWVPMNAALEVKGQYTVVSNYGSGGDPRKRGERACHEPSATVTGKVTRNKLRSADGKVRGMTHIEAGLLQTFPPDFPWSGRDVAQQIGNAIPPRLAAYVLSAALKLPSPTEYLDRAVKLPWASTKNGVPALAGAARQL